MTRIATYKEQVAFVLLFELHLQLPVFSGEEALGPAARPPRRGACADPAAAAVRIDARGALALLARLRHERVVARLREGVAARAAAVHVAADLPRDAARLVVFREVVEEAERLHRPGVHAVARAEAAPSGAVPPRLHEAVALEGRVEEARRAAHDHGLPVVSRRSQGVAAVLDSLRTPCAAATENSETNKIIEALSRMRASRWWNIGEGGWSNYGGSVVHAETNPTP